MNPLFAIIVAASISWLGSGLQLAENGDAARPVGLAQPDAFAANLSAEEIVVAPGQSKILRSKTDVRRASVDDGEVCEVVVTTPRELSILGKKPGRTTITFWLADDRYEPVTLNVRVAPAK